MQPRERYSLLGPDPFSSEELLALILGTGTSDRPVRAIATQLLDDLGPTGLLHAPLPALAGVHGVGPVRAIRIHAALALARRLLRQPPEPAAPVTSPHEAAAWFLPHLDGLPHEELHALLLDRRARPLRYQRLTSGGSAGTSFEIRQILQHALSHGAHGLLIAHNHPSGDPSPSPEDRRATHRLAQACQSVGLSLLDHLIIGGSRWISLTEQGEIRPQWLPPETLSSRVSLGPTS